jgi:hypothetical protein
MSTPMRRTFSRYCARAASGHVAATPPSNVMNWRRFIIRHRALAGVPITTIPV